MRHTPRWARALCAGLAFTLPLLVQAQAYPSKPVKLIVPFTAGGAVDIYARTVQAALAEELGQPIVVDNRAGASGMIGADAVAKSPPDGYTLMVGNIAILAMNPGVYPKMPFDVLKDFTPIVQTVQVNYVLVVTNSLPVKSVAELIAYARANPGKLTYGSSGSGSAQHMAAELFKAQTHTFITHIPYKGTGALVGDLIAGHISMIFADQGSMMPQVKSGKLRALAVTSARRSTSLPDVPTVAELGFKDFDVSTWYGLFMPAGTPKDVVTKVNAEVNKLLDTPEMKAAIHTQGAELQNMTPEQFSALLKSDYQKWKGIVQASGATIE